VQLDADCMRDHTQLALPSKDCAHLLDKVWPSAAFDHSSDVLRLLLGAQ
jgi:hypothetical protein